MKVKNARGVRRETPLPDHPFFFLIFALLFYFRDAPTTLYLRRAWQRTINKRLHARTESGEKAEEETLNLKTGLTQNRTEEITIITQEIQRYHTVTRGRVFTPATMYH